MSSHNPPPPTPSAFQSKEEQEKYIYPDSTLDKAFIISKIRSLLGDYTKENGTEDPETSTESSVNPATSPPTASPHPSASPFASPAPVPPAASPSPLPTVASQSPLQSPTFLSPRGRSQLTRNPSMTTPPPAPLQRSMHGPAHRPTTASTPPHYTPTRVTTPTHSSAAQTPTPTHANTYTTPIVAHAPTPSRVPPLSLTPSEDGTPRNERDADESIDESENINYGPEKEKIDTCCILWDISSSPEHSKFLHENHILPVLQTTLVNAQSARLVEVAIGIVANMASVPSIAEDITNHEISSIITSQLFITLDPPVLNETCRMIAACIYTPACQDHWVDVLSNNQFQGLQQVLDILQNTLDQELLERVLMLAAILIYIEPLQKELVSRKIGDIVSQVLVEQMTGDNMPNEHVLELFMRVLEGIVCIPSEPGSENALSDLNDNFIKCMCRIVARNDSEEIVAAAVTILYSTVVHETAVSVLANDEEFCRALIDLVSSESTFEWSLLLAMMEMKDSHALTVIDECLESILNISSEGKEIKFVVDSITKIKNKLEQQGSKFKASVQKIDVWLNEKH